MVERNTAGFPLSNIKELNAKLTIVNGKMMIKLIVECTAYLVKGEVSTSVSFKMMFLMGKDILETNAAMTLTELKLCDPDRNNDPPIHIIKVEPIKIISILIHFVLTRKKSIVHTGSLALMTCTELAVSKEKPMFCDKFPRRLATLAHMKFFVTNLLNNSSGFVIFIQSKVTQPPIPNCSVVRANTLWLNTKF